MNLEEANQKILELMNKSSLLSKKEIQLFKELIFQCDLKTKDTNGLTTLMYVLFYNQDQNLKLNKKQLDYLIKNSDLKIQDKDGLTPLLYALENNKEQSLQLSSKQFKTMYDALNEEQKQITFKKLIKENVENNHNYVEEINVLLYDCKFKPNQETINWLTKNKHQDILQMIEKRDVFFQLNQKVKLMDNHQKIATIKI